MAGYLDALAIARDEMQPVVAAHEEVAGFENRRCGVDRFTRAVTQIAEHQATAGNPQGKRIGFATRSMHALRVAEAFHLL
ncbi:hypothetical protein D3C71_1934660 [compost metagenome]